MERPRFNHRDKLDPTLNYRVCVEVKVKTPNRRGTPVLKWLRRTYSYKHKRWVEDLVDRKFLATALRSDAAKKAASALVSQHKVVYLEALPQQARSSYPKGIQFIVEHHGDIGDAGVLAKDLVVQAIAAAFNMHPVKVANDVIAARAAGP